MSARPYSKAAAILLTVVGTALSGTIAAFLVMIYFASFQLAAAGAPGCGEAEGCSRAMDAAPCRPR